MTQAPGKTTILNQKKHSDSHSPSSNWWQIPPFSVLFAFFALSGFLLVGCEHASVLEGDGEGCNTSFNPTQFPAPTVSFQNDVLPILASNGCSSSSCHGNASNPSSGFSVLNATSILGPGNWAIQLETCDVIRGNPEDSFLIKKLLGTAERGAQMPLGGSPLSDADLDVIEQWILEGARDN